MNASQSAVAERALLLRTASELATERSEATEVARRLDGDVVEAMRASGSFRLFVPSIYGGPGISVPQALAEILELSRADGAAGWCAAIASTTSHVAGSIDPQWATTMFGDPRSITGGGFAPNGQATMNADGGLNVTGKWAWGSGSQHCDWICGGTLDADMVFRIAFFDAADVTIHDTWFSSGLRGTGSHDFEVSGATVPAGRWSLPIGGKAQVDDPIARTPMFSLFAGGIASVMLGIARRAIDEANILAQSKRPAHSSKTLIESPMTHVEIGRAEGLWRSASAWLSDEIGAVWDTVVAGDRVSTEQRAAVRAAATHASVSARQATDIAYDLGGGSSVYSGSPLQRCFRDVHTASAHVMVNARNTETFGRTVLGLPVDAAML